ncbi:N-acetylglucosamine-6-phosphate deacetylase [Antarctobacter jejuensis]|uniref:N-acetylglucosamine-6-phosphate deacetylase n=1 Tax=Antarctobacter jejuensis TaxID=1439938 RepID=UPI003FD3E168
MSRITYTGARIFDGTQIVDGHALILEDGRVAGIVPDTQAPKESRHIALEGGVLTPGFVDLQANGGGGMMFNDETSVEGLRVIAAAHWRTGTRAFLPTLITDTPDKTVAAIAAVEEAVSDGVRGIAGLHLEGPHLDVARKGAHDPELIRKMTTADVDVLCEAVQRLPRLKVTLAPESCTPAQISRLSRSGVLISLGHTDCRYDVARVAFSAGASLVTHLFNAMSGLGHREPGLVGATLETGPVSVGLIADGHHVHPAAIRIALASKRGPGQVYLVTDAMATLGSDVQEFQLNGRRVLRGDSRLMLEDGTLAGADLTMPQALRYLTQELCLPEEDALAKATSIPGAILDGGAALGRFVTGQPATPVYLDPDGVYQEVDPALS